MSSISVGDVRDHALDALGTWMSGYTDPAEGQEQHRVVVLIPEDGDGPADLRVAFRPADRGPSELFKVTITVQALGPEA